MKLAKIQIDPDSLEGSPMHIEDFPAKVYHMAKLIRPDGAVSPLCAPKPRAINLGKASWTIRKEAVTCKKCLAILAEQAQRQKGSNDAKM